MVALAVAGAACPAHAQGTASPLMRPTGVAYDTVGDLFIADAARSQVFEITVGGAITVVAGNGTQGFAGDGGPATAAELNAPMSVAVAADGTLYIADTGNQRVRVVQGGEITAFAGSGARGFAGDGGLATAAALNQPVALALDATGALLVCDQGNERVRRISAGQIATIAGNGVQGFAGDGGAATSAELNEPSGVAARPDGRVFIADTNNQRVRVVGINGTISTFAGTGIAGIHGDGGPASAAQLSRPVGLVIDAATNVFVADENSHRLRRIAADGTITTIAGSGQQGGSPDGAVAVSSAQNQPMAVAISIYGWPVIGDPANRSVQIVFSDGRLYSPGGLSTRTTTLTAAAPNAVYGTAHSTISIAGSPATPQGTVQISDDRTLLGSASLSQGTATIALPSLSAGTHTLTATYAGDGLHPSASAATSIVVSPAPVTATAAATTINYGAPLPTLIGTLSGVLPQDQGKVTAVFTANAPPMASVDSYPISATLTGAASANYTLSSSANSGTLTIVPAATTATLTPPSAAYATLPLQLTARVASTTSGTPTGTAQFFDAGNLIATAPLVNGSASAIELNSSTGNHTLSVAYSGDTNFQASTSANVIQAVNAMPDFTLGIAGSSQQTVIAGSSATFGLTVGSQAAPFTGAVTLSANGLPAGATVSFSPPAIVPGASSAPVTMTVVTRATTALNTRMEPELALAAGGVIFLLMLRRRRTLTRLLAALAVAGLFGIAGCGARTASESVLPLQSFGIQVQATGTNLAGNVVVHTVSVTLGVE
jgi:sugar lactone lactonase YvrE